MVLMYNKQLANIHVISERSKISIETATPYYEKKVFKISWKEGSYQLHIEHHDMEIISIKLDYSVGYWIGKITVEMRVFFQEFKDLYLETDYSLNGARKALDLKVDYGTLSLSWIQIRT